MIKRWSAPIVVLALGVIGTVGPVASGDDSVSLVEVVKDRSDVADRGNTIAWQRFLQPHTGATLEKKHSYDFQTSDYTGNGNITVCSALTGWYSHDYYAYKCGTNTATASFPRHPNTDTMLAPQMINSSGAAHTLTGSASY